MARQSAGIVLYRFAGEEPEVLLVHPGGPFWRNRDAGAWSIPKGEYAADEDPLAVAKREFEEELGMPAPSGEYVRLGEVRQRGGKTVTVIAGLPRNTALLRELCQELKRACGTGGAVSEDTIELQGDLRDRVREYLLEKKFVVKG